MIAFPKDGMKKFIQGLLLGGRIKDALSVMLVPLLMVIASFVVISIDQVYGWSVQLYEFLPAQLQSPFIQANILGVWLKDVTFLWAFALLVQRIFAGKSVAAAKSIWFYFGRMLIPLFLLSFTLWSGIFLGFGIRACVRYWMLHMASVQYLLLAIVCAVGVMALMYAAFFSMSFFPALLFHNKSFRDAISQGRMLFAQQWPFVVALLLVFLSMRYMVMSVSVPLLYWMPLLVPSIIDLLYWAVFLQYYKRLIIRRK